MTSVKTKIAAWFVWFSTWGFGFSILFFLLSFFMPMFRGYPWLLFSVVFLVFIIAGVAYHMGPILPDAISQGEDSMKIARKQQEGKKKDEKD
ncbi:MAG: hypothetical protein HZB68_03935 [Candidatus Aenigmarchaeota archaeon]|nr:hypothetical protein [Candidatus Aenigmarchaeota archaeon]